MIGWSGVVVLTRKTPSRCVRNCAPTRSTYGWLRMKQKLAQCSGMKPLPEAT